MKKLFLCLLLAGCAHEQTKIDREVMLKIVDKLPDVKIVQVSGPQLQQQAEQSEGSHCNVVPFYNTRGQVIEYRKQCSGAN